MAQGTTARAGDLPRVPLSGKILTSGQSRLTERPHRRRTWTVQLYSSGGANVHPIRVSNPNGISIGSAVFAGLTIVAVWQTDRQTTLLGRCNNRLHLRT